MPLPAVVDLGTYVGPLDHRPWTSRPALFKSLICISSCDSHLSFSTKPLCCLFKFALTLFFRNSMVARVAHLLDAPAVEPSHQTCAQSSAVGAGRACSRRARPRCSHAGWASTRRQRRWRSCSTLSRPRRAPWEVPPHGGAPASLRRRCGHPTAAEARPPCSGPPAELDRSAWRRSDAKASLRWRPVAHPTSTADGALVCSLQCVSSTRDAACGPSEQGSDLCLAAVM